MSTYQLTLSPVEYNIQTSKSEISLSLSRTGGQGSKGDSVSNAYVSNNILYIEISDGAGNLIQTINAGDLSDLINENIPLTDLSDVNIVSPASGDVISYNGISGNWEVETLGDTYYTKVEVDGITSGKSDNGHIHDDRYYRKTEVDTFLTGKSDTSHTHTLTQLTDTSIVNPAGDQVLRYDGVDWVNSNLALSDVSDFNIDPSVVSGEILRWDGSNWINNTLAEANIATATHTHTLDQLSDVSDTAAVDGETVLFNSGTHSWVTRKITTSDIGDIDNTNKADGAVLVYSGTSSKYEANIAVIGGTF